MLTFFSFLLMWLGSLNWFFISAFQYDFVAGFFGTQSSLFSRFIYFLIGIAGFIMLIIAIKNRGKIKLIENPFRKKTLNNNVITPVKVVPDNQNLSIEQQYQNDDIVDENQEIIQPTKDVNVKFNITPETTQKEGFKDFDVTKYDN